MCACLPALVWDRCVCGGVCVGVCVCVGVVCMCVGHFM